MWFISLVGGDVTEEECNELAWQVPLGIGKEGRGVYNLVKEWCLGKKKGELGELPTLPYNPLKGKAWRIGEQVAERVEALLRAMGCVWSVHGWVDVGEGIGGGCMSGGRWMNARWMNGGWWVVSEGFLSGGRWVGGWAGWRVGGWCPPDPPPYM